MIEFTSNSESAPELKYVGEVHPRSAIFFTKEACRRTYTGSVTTSKEGETVLLQHQQDRLRISGHPYMHSQSCLLCKILVISIHQGNRGSQLTSVVSAGLRETAGGDHSRSRPES